MKDLATAIADARSDAQALRRTGNVGQADHLERVLSEIALAAEPYMAWLSEDDAILRSGLTERGIRRRFRGLLECGLARHGNRGRREYLECAIPRRANVAAAYRAGLEGDVAA